MQLHGLHHVTAVTGNVKANVDFYTKTLGLRLVKKTVNQDDVSAYHMFYADKLGSPGTDMTFFDWPHTAQDIRGTDSVVNTMFRVNGMDALQYWHDRFESQGVKHGPLVQWAGTDGIVFEDGEGQRMALIDDRGTPFHGEVWDGTDVPVEYGIRGFYGVSLSVPNLEQYEPIFTVLMNFEKVSEHPALFNPNERVAIYAMDGGGPGKEVHVAEQPSLRPAFLGRGGVHHVAFRINDVEEQQAWMDRLASYRVRNSGPVDRFYFKSLYFRISNGILFELATDGPGFASDEPLETLGQKLALPPFLEPQRAQIEAGLKPV